MKRLMITILSAVALLTAPMPASAAKGNAGFDMAAMFRPMTSQEEKGFKTRLKLSDDQLASLRDINRSYRQDVQNLNSNYRSAREDLLNALKSADPHSQNIARRMGDVHRAQSNLVDKEVMYWSQVAEVFTPEQADSFWKMFARNRIRGGHGGMATTPETEGGSGKYDLQESGGGD